MIVREAEPGEHDEVRSLLTTAYRQYAGAVAVTALFDSYLAGVVDIDAAAGRAVTLVAVAEDGIAGTARLYPAGRTGLASLPADWAWVRAVGVAPGQRRTGIASLLMAECLRRARAGGATVLCLHTMTFMPGAIRLYERLGYRRVPELDLDIAARHGMGGEMVALAYRLDIAS